VQPQWHGLCSSLFPLPCVERQPIVLRRERDLRALWKVKHVARLRIDLLARLILDRHAALNHDLALVVRVRVHERRALFETVEAAGDGLVWVGFVAEVRLSGRCDRGEGEGRGRVRGDEPAEDVAEVGVFVCDQRGLEVCLSFGVVVHAERGHCGYLVRQVDSTRCT
jgi:hypothetical protein